MALVAALLLSACSSDTPPASYRPPTLPPECEASLPEVALTPPGESTEDAALNAVYGFRASGNTVFYHGSASADGGVLHGIFAVDVPDGVPELVTWAPDGVRWQDFWIGDDGIVAVAHRAIYTAPRSGGPAILASGMAQSDVNGAYYARRDDFMYVAVEGTDPHVYGTILRAPWRSGEFSPVTNLNNIPLPVHNFIPGKSFLFYNDSDRVLALSDDGASQVIWTEGIALGENDGLYATRELCDPASSQCLFRMVPGSAAAPERISLPAGVTIPDQIATIDHAGSAHPALVSYKGDGYFVARAEYALPDDRRATRRPVLVRVRAGSHQAELVRCIPPPAFDPRLPSSFQGAEVEDIAATDAGVFVLRTRTWSENVEPTSSQRIPIPPASEPYVVKVWP